MMPFLAADLFKLRKRWMPRIIVLLLMALVVLIFWASATTSADRPNLLLPRAWIAALDFGGIVAPFFWPVLGGSWAGGEYGWGTIRMVLSRKPSRIEFVVAALIALVIAAAAGLIAILLAGTVASVVVAAFTGNSAFLGGVLTASFVGTLIKVFLACLYVCTFYLVLSYTAGTIFRSSAVGIGVGIGLTFAEFIVSGIFDHLGGKWAGFAEHFPIQYTTALPQRVAVPGLLRGTGMAQVGSNVPHVGESLGFLAIYMAVLLLITFILVRARDVTS